jgi:hypothetical protein
MSASSVPLYPYKLIVAGSRDFNDYPLLSQSIFDYATSGVRPIQIVSGMARGADALAVRFAREHSVTLFEFPAEWDRLGKGAGFIRNEKMGNFSDGLLAFWDGQSRGTKHMIDYMNKIKKPVQIIQY